VQEYARESPQPLLGHLLLGREDVLLKFVRSENPTVVTGDQMRTLSDAQLMRTLDTPELIFARVSADQKDRIVKALKDKKQIVAVTGYLPLRLCATLS
jgi:magnesium-transporting ATPase (P-type)